MYFPYCHRQGYVLSLSSAELNNRLKLSGPVDGAACIRNNVANPGQRSLRPSAVASGPPVSKICTNMALKTFGNIRLEDNTLILERKKILANPLHGSFVEKSRDNSETNANTVVKGGCREKAQLTAKQRCTNSH